MLTVQLDPSLRDIAGSGKHIFVDGQSTIRFGRSMESEVRFSPSDTRLGRNHFSLRPAAGSYELVTDREHPVFMNGERVVGSVALLAETELRLADAKTGPKITINISQMADGNITDANFKTDGGTVQQSMKYLRHAIVAGLGVAIILAGVVGYQAYAQKQLQLAFATETSSLLEKFSKVQNPSAKWSEVYDKIRGSVYQVAILSNDGSAPEAKGTAWVYGAHSLVTNAHVAALFINATPNQTVVVIAPDGQQTPIKVVDAILHPAYLAFRQTISSTERSTNASIKSLGSFDVAMLMIGSSAHLAAPLKVASAETLQHMPAGLPLAYVGYPAAYANTQNAEQFRIGYVSGSSDFLGVAGSSPGELIYHTAQAVGGASGSPIVNDQGEVIAVFSGGEVQKLGDDKVVSGSGTFYAQSASLIADVVNGWSAEKMAAAQNIWSAGTLYLAKRNQIWALLQSYRDGNSLERFDAPPVFESKAALSALTGTRSTTGEATASWSNAKPGTYVAFAVPKTGKDKLALRIQAGGASLQSPLYLDAAPTAVFKVEAAEDVLFSVSGTLGEDYWLQVLPLERNEVLLNQIP